MQHPRTDSGRSGSYWGEKEKTASVPIPLMTRTTLSHNFRILASMGNPVSCAQVDGNGSMSSTQSG